jgi:hypothetical protein
MFFGKHCFFHKGVQLIHWKQYTVYILLLLSWVSGINPSFYASFWAYGLGDINVPTMQYDVHIEKLQSQIKHLPLSKEVISIGLFVLFCCKLCIPNICDLHATPQWPFGKL